MRRSKEGGFTVLEFLIGSVIMAILMLVVYKILFAPYKMTQQLNDSTLQEVAARALDIVISDLQQTNSSAFPFASLTPATGELPSWIGRTQRDASTPYTFVQYQVVPIGDGRGDLIRYESTVTSLPAGNTQLTLPTTTAGAKTSTVLHGMALPAIMLADGSVAPKLFSIAGAGVLSVEMAYAPDGIQEKGHQAYYRIQRRVALRS